MTRLELIKEIHDLTKNKKKREIPHIKNKLIAKEFEDFEKSFFDEWNKPENKIKRISKKHYIKELLKLQMELVTMHEYVKLNGVRVIVLFEGRDAAGKGGVIKPLRGH